MSKAKTLAVITARGGSKGIPRKNLISINGKPLIAYSIEAGLKSKYITKTIVSSDDQEILDTSINLGAEIVKRPDELASDLAASEPAILHTIQELQKQGQEFDLVVLLQPTSPLRTAQDIDNAIELFLKNKKATALISVFEMKHTAYKAFKVEKGNTYLESIFEDKTPFKRRQDLPDTYYPNGAIYIVYAKDFLKTNKLLTNKTIPYIMSQQKSTDVDTMEDVQEIERILLAKN